MRYNNDNPDISKETVKIAQLDSGEQVVYDVCSDIDPKDLTVKSKKMLSPTNGKTADKARK